MIDPKLINTVSNASVMDLVETCRSLEILDDASFESLGINPSVIENIEQRFPEDKLIELWTLIHHASVFPEIGLIIGQTVNASSKGVLASWVSQCNSVAEAIETFTRYIPLMNPSESWEKRGVGKDCHLVFSLKRSDCYPVIAIERSMSAMITWGRMLSGHEFPLIEVRFAFSRPDYHQSITEVFGENILYDAPENTLVFNKALLDLPLIGSNLYLKRIMEERAKEVWGALMGSFDEGSKPPVSNDFTSKTVASIRKTLRDKGVINISIVCNDLNVSRQTLYRKLKQEGSDFKTLSDRFKKEEALRLFQSEQETPFGIALSLGYKDTSSLYKAFKRWYGVSPKAYLAGDF